ncbi:MAG: aminomethyl transferase family protein [Deltaproteobacteria bacterium]|nr:aminomethyl transferase family protein [Deltaproteobacteria bacterium]
MPIPSPFHERTAPLNTSQRWKDWAGFYAACAFGPSIDREYFAFRHTAGLIDVTPLYKYEVRGKDAAAMLSRMMVRNVAELRVGRVGYTCWCDDAGRVIDDGTVARLEEDHFRVTAADPTYYWLAKLSRGYEVDLEDSTETLAALALQGPMSREILRRVCDADLDTLKFFGITRANLDGKRVFVSRTGYTGDLGYEVWVDAREALAVWDAIMAAGRTFGVEPTGLDALDVTRIEAGFIMLDVDYHGAHKVVQDPRKSSPYEIGLGWTIASQRGPFVGKSALAAEARDGSKWQLVGLELSWEQLESLYESHGLPPNLPTRASREPIPVYADKKQVGRATSHTWSPILKKSIALASVHAPYAKPGTKLEIEHTVEFERRRVPAVVTKTPFFDPERKRKP